MNNTNNKVTTIAAAASSRTDKVWSKDKAFTELLEIIENNGVMDEMQQMQLYRHFTPTLKNSKVKTPEQWCKLAICKDQSRPALCNLLVKDGYMIVTDSRRLHITKTQLVDGVYDKNLIRTHSVDEYEKCEASFPEYGGIRNISDCRVKTTTKKELLSTLKIAEVSDNRNRANFVSITIDSGFESAGTKAKSIVFDEKYLMDLFSGFDDTEMLTVFFKDKDLTPMHVYSANNAKQSILMPIRLC